MKTAKTKQPEMSTAQFTSLIIMMGWSSKGIKLLSNVYAHPTNGDWIQIKGAINSIIYSTSENMKVRSFTKASFIKFLAKN